MSELMQWFYAHYIKPTIESQPKDDGEELRFSLYQNSLAPDQQKDSQAVLAFYAVQGFRLGLKTGLALADELKPGS